MRSKHQERRELQERRDDLLEQAKSIVEKVKRERGEDANLTRSEQTEFDGLMDDIDDINERLLDLPRRDPVARGAFEDDNEGPSIRTEGEMNDSDERRAVDRFLRTGEIADDLRGETRAGDQSIGTGSEGGVLASTGFTAEVFDVMQAHGGLPNTRVTMIDTDHGRAFNRPGVDDVDNTASIVSEGSTIGGTTSISFFDVQFDAHAYQAGPITLTREQLQDSQVDVVEVVRDKLGQRIARGVNADYAGSTVTSTTAPNGLVTASTGPVTIAAGSSNLSLQTLRDLHFSVDPAWRPNAEWAMSDAAFQAVADLEDSEGRPLVNPDVQEGFGPALFGKPIRVVQDLDDLSASTNFPIFFGDMSAFGIRRVRDVRVQRLDEKFSLQRRVGFLAWFRTDSRPMWSSTISSSNNPIRALRTT